MTASPEALITAVGLAATMSAYALFSGADFGGGIWDLLAGGTARGEKPRAAIDASVTPVWEANHVWIVLGLVILWTCFPAPFAAVMTALFVPLALSLLGIVLRGVGFAFRHESRGLTMTKLYGAMFAASSFIAPFFLGATVGAVATGRVPAHPTGSILSAWTTPTAVLTGVLFVSTCAYIGAVYLVADSKRRDEPEMVTYFSRRAIAAGLVTGLLAAANLALLHTSAPRLFDRLFGPALPLVLSSAVAGLAALGLVVVHRIHLLRLAAATAVASVVGAWAWAQYPWVLPNAYTLESGSAPIAALRAELAVFVLAALLVVPSFVYLYALQQRGQLQQSESSRELQQATSAEKAQDEAQPEEATRSHPIAVTAVLVAAASDLVRDAAHRRRHR